MNIKISSNSQVINTNNKYCADNLYLIPNTVTGTISTNGATSAPAGTLGYDKLYVNCGPKLHTPSITFDSQTTTITVSDKDNGKFSSSINLYQNNNFIRHISSKSCKLIDQIPFDNVSSYRVKVCGKKVSTSDFSNSIIWKLQPPKTSVNYLNNKLTLINMNHSSIAGCYEISYQGKTKQFNVNEDINLQSMGTPSDESIKIRFIDHLNQSSDYTSEKWINRTFWKIQSEVGFDFREDTSPQPGFYLILRGSGDIYLDNVKQVSISSQDQDYYWSKELPSTNNVVHTIELKGEFISCRPTIDVPAGGGSAYIGWDPIKIITGDNLRKELFSEQFTHIGCASDILNSLPSYITTLPQNCFYMCSNAKYINNNWIYYDLAIPDFITRIENQCFSNTTAKKLILPKNLQFLDRFILGNGSYIEEIVYPSGYTIFNEGSFIDSIKLKTLRFQQPAGIHVTFPAAGQGTGHFFSKTARNVNIYTDNLDIKNYDWVSDGITPTFFHLDGTAW